MKNIIKTLALAALCIASFSCAKNETFVSESTDIHFTLRTGDVKTYIEEGNVGGKTIYTPYWNKGDEIGVLFEGFAKDKKSADKLSNTNENGAEASFEGTIRNVPANEGTLYAFYPATMLATTYVSGEEGSEVRTVGFDIPGVQNPTATSFDPKADLLIAKPVYYYAEEGSVLIDDVFFARALSVLRINLYSTDYAPIQNQYLSKVTVTATGGVIGGRPVINLEEGYANIVKNNKSTTESVAAVYDGEVVKIGATADAASNSVFLVVIPGTLGKGKSLKIEAETEGYNISREITLTTDIVLNPGKLTEINLGLAEANCEEIKTETRILVENFDNVIAQSQASADKTGVTGTGVTDKLTYTYSTANTNVRVNNNGHGNSNPFLWISGANQYLQIGNIAVSNETDLKFSCQVKTTSGSAKVSLKYKASSAQEWSTAAGEISATTSSINDVQSLIFSISKDVTSLDLQIVGSAGSLVVDDIVLEKFVDERVALTVPANVAAEADANTVNKINVTWEAVENAGSYEVTLQTTGQQDVVETVETNSISFTGLEYSTEYSVKVKAIPSDISKYKDSEYSSDVKVTTGEQPAVLLEWKKKAIADILPSDEVVLVGNGTNTLKATASSNNPALVSITVANDKITSEVTEDMVWNLVGNNTDGFTLYAKDNKNVYLYCNTTAKTSSNTCIRVGKSGGESIRNLWIINGDGYMVTKDDYTIRYLSVNGTTDWRGYINTNTNPQKVDFYVKDDPRTALATPVITLTPNSEAKTIKAEWGSISGAADYTVSCTGKTDVTTTETSCTFTELAVGEYTITVTANPSNTTDNKPGSASKTAKIEGSTQTSFASLEELVAAGTPTGEKVTITFSNKEIKSIYVTTTGYRNGIFLPVNSTVKNEIEIFSYDVPEEWEVGGLVSGTLTDCEWKEYNGTWELCPENWTELTYIAPAPKCETPVITLEGAQASITCATEGATILYEISDTQPASFTKTYSAAVTLTDGQTIWAKATKTDYKDSEVASKKYSSSSEKTYTATITVSNFNGGSSWSSYANKTGVVAGTDSKNYNISGDSICYNKDYIQNRSSKGSAIYNTTSFGKIKSIAITDDTDAAFTVKVGSSSKDGCTVSTTADGTRTFNVTGDYGYFKIVNSNSTIAHTSKIVITYTN